MGVRGVFGQALKGQEQEREAEQDDEEAGQHLAEGLWAVGCQGPPGRQASSCQEVVAHRGTTHWSQQDAVEGVQQGGRHENPDLVWVFHHRQHVHELDQRSDQTSAHRQFTESVKHSMSLQGLGFGQWLSAEAGAKGRSQHRGGEGPESASEGDPEHEDQSGSVQGGV